MPLLCDGILICSCSCSCHIPQRLQRGHIAAEIATIVVAIIRRTLFSIKTHDTVPRSARGAAPHGH
jgi:hypothetical protein